MNTNYKNPDKEIKVQYADKITDTTLTTISFNEVVSKIKNGDYKDAINTIRAAEDKGQRNKLKAQLPYFNMGAFQGNIRNNTNFIATDHLIFDIDQLNGQYSEIRKKITEDKNIFCMFQSPSGNGLKVIARLQTSIQNEAEYKSVYEHHRLALSDKYGVKFDATSDPARACFLSYDPDIHLNNGSEPLEVIIKPTVVKKSSVTTVNYDKAELKEAVNYLKGVETTYPEWLKLGFALASIGEDGREYFIEISKSHPVHGKDSPSVINEQFNNCLASYDPNKSTIRTLFHMAEQHGYVAKRDKFWFVAGDKTKISRVDLMNFLEKEGFGKFYQGNTFIFIRIKDNVVSEIVETQMKDYVREYVEKIGDEAERTSLLEQILNPANAFFSRNFLSGLKNVELSFRRDTKEKSYFYFRNCYVEVTESSITEKNYAELDWNVWKGQIIDRDFKYDETESDMEKFFMNICGSDPARFDALRSSIGYLLHTYKNPALTKAVIFTDEADATFEKGRTGKGLCIQAIEKLRNVTDEDGRNFKPNSNFAFQKVNLDTQIIAFNDLSKDFEFERLFSILTDGYSIEKKNQAAYYVPYSEGPKVVLSTNFVVKGYGSSDEARKFEIEFSNYYSSTHTPQDDFGKLFFDDWTDEEWNRFYTLMIKCCQYFLRVGLKSYKHVNLQQKKLVENTSEEFLEYISGKELNVEYEKKELLKEFHEQFPGNNNLKMKSFTKWQKYYCDENDLEYVSRKSNSKTLVMFSEKSAYPVMVLTEENTP